MTDTFRPVLSRIGSNQPLKANVKKVSWGTMSPNIQAKLPKMMQIQTNNAHSITWMWWPTYSYKNWAKNEVKQTFRSQGMKKWGDEVTPHWLNKTAKNKENPTQQWILTTNKILWITIAMSNGPRMGPNWPLKAKMCKNGVLRYCVPQYTNKTAKNKANPTREWPDGS